MKTIKDIIEYVDKAFIENRETIEKFSKRNCHIKGLHSIVFEQREDGGLRRLYFANNNHKMDLIENLAIHTHHRDLTLTRLTGRPHNYMMRESYVDRRGGCFRQFEFKSELSNKGGRFLPVEDVANFKISPALIPTDMSIATDTIMMSSTDAHTMTVPKGESASWFVTEGLKEDKNYSPLCLSMKDLTTWDKKKLYKPMSYQMALEIWEDIKANL